MKKISFMLCLMAVLSVFAACEKTSQQETQDLETQELETQIKETAAPTEESDDETSTEENTSESYEAVTIENFDRTTTYEKMPERAVALSYSIAELMVAMGLEDKIVAIAPSMYVFEQILPEYQKVLSGIPVLEGSGGAPNLETVLEVDPDFVYGDSYSFSPNNCGAAEDYKAVGINIYSTEGTYTDDATIENTYNDIIKIGRIFKIEERANELVAGLKERMNAIQEKVAGQEKVKVFILDYTGQSSDAFQTIGGAGLQNFIIESAGGENIFQDVEKDFFATSLEEIITANPEVIVIYDYYSDSYAEDTIERLKNMAELAEVPAIANERIIVVSGLSVFPSLQNIDAIEKIAAGLYPDLF